MTDSHLNGGEQEIPLRGYTIAVTASRRREELRTAFEKRGAKVLVASTLQIMPLATDEELYRATQICIETKPDFVVGTTGIGFRGWMEAADGWGLGEQLRAALSDSQIVARGPKARGAIRASGLCEMWTPTSESMSEVLEYLIDRDIHGKRIAVQLHGEPSHDVVSTLEATGAKVVPVPVYRWLPPEDIGAVKNLIEAVITKQIDAITFTSAPAVAGLLQVAKDNDLEESLLNALSYDVIPICVGPVCSAPLDRKGIASVVPPRSRLGSLIKTVAEVVPIRTSKKVVAGGKTFEVRGHAVAINNLIVDLPPVPMVLLRTLARDPGKVFSRHELKQCMGSNEDGGLHAVEMAVARLRVLLDEPQIIQTVVKRGYRLRCDPLPRNQASDGDNSSSQIHLPGSQLLMSPSFDNPISSNTNKTPTRGNFIQEHPPV